MISVPGVVTTTPCLHVRTVSHMALAPASHRASSAGRLWQSPDELREYAPVLKLLTSLWTIPEITRIGLSADGLRVTVWAFTAKEDMDAESRVYALERQFLNSAPMTALNVQVVPLSDVPESALPPYETIIER